MKNCVCCFALAWALAGAAATGPFGDGDFMVGCNYWGSQAGVHMWRAADWDEDGVRKDLDALKSAGVEMLRVFPTWSEFQPLVPRLGYAGMPGEFLREGTEETVSDPLWIDPGALARFRFFCDEAGKRQIKLMVSLVTGWMSGRLFIPRHVEGRNLLSDPEAIRWEGRFARGFVRRMKDHPAIVAWDLGNECNCMGTVGSQGAAWVWLQAISGSIRAEDSSRPVVSGMHSQTSNAFGAQWSKPNYWTLQMQGELMDYLTPHPYPAPFRTEANRGAFNSFRNALHPLSQCLYYAGVAGKPAFPQEVGSLGPRMSPEWVAALGMRQQLFAAWVHGLPAYLWWCAFDQKHLGYPPFNTNAMERELGMLRKDRTFKPQAHALKAFADFRKSLPFKRLPPYRTDAVCLLSEREEFYHQAFGALMLAKAAGFDVAFAGAESQALPESPFYILPSGGGFETWSQEAWERLVARVRKGATLLVTRGGDAGYSDWIDVTGLEQTLYHKKRPIVFAFEGRKLRASDHMTAEQRTVDCEAVARDQTGNVVVSMKKLGEGKVVAVNFALEKCIIEGLDNVVDGDFSNELWRIYAYAAREAGVRRCVQKEDPRLVLTEHPRDDGTLLVCALNTGAERKSFALAVAGAVEQFWNGRWADGRLELEGNAGCILKIAQEK